MIYRFLHWTPNPTWDLGTYWYQTLSPVVVERRPTTVLLLPPSNKALAERTKQIFPFWEKPESVGATRKLSFTVPTASAFKTLAGKITASLSASVKGKI